MAKKDKKSLKKITEKKFGPAEVTESEEPLEKIVDSLGENIENKKFIEFLGVSTEPIETLASKKPRNTKSIEQDEEVLSFTPKQEEKKKENGKEDYFARITKDYDLVSPREEKRQDISTKSFQPQRVNIQEMGREMRTPLRETFVPNDGMNRLASPGRSNDGEKNYEIERVDFNDVGREKRYKLMK
jgi:hypothetical protein